MARLGVRVVVALGLWVVAGSLVQAGPPDRGQAKDRADLVARLKTEAESIDLAKLSPLFRAILTPGRDAKWPLSDEEVTLTRRCGELTRDILRNWLIRDLDADPPLSIDLLTLRLANPGRKLGERVVRHAEAVVIEGILPIAEARRGYAASGRKPEPYLVGRDGPVLCDVEGWSGETDGNLALEIATRHWSCDAEATSPLTRALLNWNSPASKRPSGRRSPQLDLEAVDLINRLKSLTNDSLRNWVARGTQGPLLPARELLLRRVALRDLVMSSVLAHADAILLEAVLRPELADEVLGQAWKDRKLEALRDPILAHRLKLTPGQRDDLNSLFHQQRDLANDCPFEPNLQERIDAFQVDDGEFETAVWKGLTGPQARALRKILEPSQPSMRRPLRGRSPR